MKWYLLFIGLAFWGCKTSEPVSERLPVCGGSYHDIVIKEKDYYVVCNIDDTAQSNPVRNSQEPFLLIDIETQSDTQNLFIMLIEEEIPEIIREMGIIGKSYCSIQISSGGHINEVKTLRTVLPYKYNYIENRLVKISQEYQVMDQTYYDRVFYVMVNLRIR
ncbi:hypothetical protein KFE94_11620 [bacterium SCSIO 12643]|nr:hypothetical protein KFE94_11620 [bacterium SCSIO 12643]